MTHAPYDALKQAVHDAGRLALDHFGKLSSLAVEAKGHLDLVSEADREIERFLSAAILKEFPDDGILGEEGADTVGTSGRIWVLDPIDGTFNFLRGRSCWGVSAGVYANGRPEYGVIYAPLLKLFVAGGPGLGVECNGVPLQKVKKFNPAMGVVNIEFSADRLSLERRLERLRYVMQDMALTFRHHGSSVISLMDLALGDVDAHMGIGESSWDIMGALPILAALGFEISLDWRSTALTDKISFFCAKPELVPDLKILLERVT